jgi:hypothetical protein
MVSTLAILLQVNAETSILRPQVATKMRDVCLKLSRTLQDTQRSDGSWSDGWSSGTAIRPIQQEWWPVHVTGHLLEAQLLLPTDIRASSTRLRRAGKFLYAALGDAIPDDVKRHYCPYSHAAKVLLDWPTSS